MLNTLGVAVGATAVDAVGRDTPPPTTLGTSTTGANPGSGSPAR